MSLKAPLKIALVGCGKIADGHVEEIRKMPERAEVAAVCDRELLMAEQMATRYSIPAFYDSYEKMLETERPDVVHITTPPQSHVPLTRAALDAGCHVYVEKPFTLSYADSKALVEHAEKARKKLTIGESCRLANRPGLSPPLLLTGEIFGPVRLTRVFHDHQVIPFRQLQNRIHVCHLAVQMHRNYCGDGSTAAARHGLARRGIAVAV